MIDLSDQEKSVLLARAMGWEIVPNYEIDEWWFVPDEDDARIVGNLYSPANMALAWRVLNWAVNIVNGNHTPVQFAKQYAHWLIDIKELGFVRIVRQSPADAQRAWLDKILSLAIEAGLIEVNYEL